MKPTSLRILLLCGCFLWVIPQSMSWAENKPCVLGVLPHSTTDSKNNEALTQFVGKICEMLSAIKTLSVKIIPEANSSVALSAPGNANTMGTPVMDLPAIDATPPDTIASKREDSDIASLDEPNRSTARIIPQEEELPVEDPSTLENIATIMATHHLDGLLMVSNPTPSMLYLVYYQEDHQKPIVSNAIHFEANRIESAFGAMNDALYRITSLLLTISISINTPIRNVEVYHQNNYIGRTPLDAMVYPGTYPLELRKKGFKTKKVLLDITAQVRHYHIDFGEIEQYDFTHQLHLGLMFLDFIKPQGAKSVRFGFQIAYSFVAIKKNWFCLQPELTLGILLLDRTNSVQIYQETYESRKEFTLFPIKVGLKQVFYPFPIPINPYISVKGGFTNVSVTQDHYQKWTPTASYHVGVQLEVRMFFFYVESLYQFYGSVPMRELTEIVPWGKHQFNERTISLYGFSFNLGVGYQFL